MKKRIFVYSLLLVASSVLAQAQTFKFDFSSDKKVQEGFTKITPATLFQVPCLPKLKLSNSISRPIRRYKKALLK